MFNVCNLTKLPLKFQGKVIPPFGSAEFALITDFVTLSRYFNAGKVSYNQFTKVVNDVEKTVVEEPVVEKIEEPVVEEIPKVEEVIETVQEPEVTVVEEPVIKEKPSKKNKRLLNEDK